MQSFMQTSQRQISLFTEEQSTSSQGDSLASHTAQQGNDLERKMTATSGQRCLEQFEKFNQPTSWQKMFMASLIGEGDWYSMKCYLKWRMKATKSHRLYFQLVVLGLTTSEKGFGFVPTPAAWDGKMYKVTLEAAQTRLHTQKGIGRQERGGLKKQMSWIHHAILFYGFTKCTANPRFSMWLMGYPLNWTELPFRNGLRSQLKREEIP